MSESGPPGEPSRMQRVMDFLHMHRGKLPPEKATKLDEQILSHERDSAPEHFSDTHDIAADQALHDAKFGHDNLDHPITDPPIPEDYWKKH